MTTYRYRTWGGRTVVVEANSVAFQPGHVVFSDVDGRILHAEQNNNVNQLTNDRAEGTAVELNGEPRRLLPAQPKETP